MHAQRRLVQHLYFQQLLHMGLQAIDPRSSIALHGHFNRHVNTKSKTTAIETRARILLPDDTVYTKLALGQNYLTGKAE